MLEPILRQSKSFPIVRLTNWQGETGIPVFHFFKLHHI